MHGIWLIWPKSSQANGNVGNRLMAGKKSWILHPWLEIHLCEDDTPRYWTSKSMMKNISPQLTKQISQPINLFKTNQLILENSPRNNGLSFGDPQKPEPPGICPPLLCTVFVRASAKAKRCSSTWASKDTGAPTPDQTLSLTIPGPTPEAVEGMSPLKWTHFKRECTSIVFQAWIFRLCWVFKGVIPFWI